MLIDIYNKDIKEVYTEQELFLLLSVKYFLYQRSRINLDYATVQIGSYFDTDCLKNLLQEFAVEFDTKQFRTNDREEKIAEETIAKYVEGLQSYQMIGEEERGITLTEGWNSLYLIADRIVLNYLNYEKKKVIIREPKDLSKIGAIDLEFLSDLFILGDYGNELISEVVDLDLTHLTYINDAIIYANQKYLQQAEFKVEEGGAYILCDKRRIFHIVKYKGQIEKQYSFEVINMDLKQAKVGVEKRETISLSAENFSEYQIMPISNYFVTEESNGVVQKLAQVLKK